MIEVSACYVVSALQGGLCMSAHSSVSQKQVAPSQVWPALSLDLRTRVIGLLAQLALNMVAARPGNESARNEVSHADQIRIPENPS